MYFHIFIVCTPSPHPPPPPPPPRVGGGGGGGGGRNHAQIKLLSYLARNKLLSYLVRNNREPYYPSTWLSLVNQKNENSIIFNINPYFNYSNTFDYVSLHLWICYAATCVHFTVPSGSRGVLLFLREQIYTSASTLNSKKQDCKTDCFIIGPPSVDCW